MGGSGDYPPLHLVRALPRDANCHMSRYWREKIFRKEISCCEGEELPRFSGILHEGNPVLKTALPFDLIRCTLAFPEIRHGVLSLLFL
jgi:hypothetical protein